MKHFLFLFTVLLLAFSCKNKEKKEITTKPISFKKEGELNIYKKYSLLAALDIEIAETEYETQTGLMHRASMEEKQGMLFIQEEFKIQNFYMKNTQISLDLIFLDKDLKIVSFQENAIPFDESSLSSQVPAKYVLEVNAGLAEKWLLEVGDSISYTR